MLEYSKVIFVTDTDTSFGPLAAASKGIEIDRSSVQLTGEDFGKDVLVLVLDETKKQGIYDDFAEAVNVYTLKEYINEQGSITNPDGGELADYAKLYETVDEVIIKLANKLKHNKI